MQAITAAALRFGVESIVETLVSQYEYRFGPKRTVNEETAHDEMVVYINGPDLANADSVIMDALDLHFGNRKNGILSPIKTTSPLLPSLKLLPRFLSPRLPFRL